ncbi:hypothetical protein EV356DRAFT_531819 [Viridothelium virens]|uniref:Uncharacterized protein n=1 Tax=Viridothelium virens TaxID=1048519 RepID=A0A6A6HCV6_VIRVR|nr:hypothetical protein EV356DRAFT_531819 [Viridothelium virens]
MPSYAAITIYAFGITAFLAGINNLLFPTSALANFDLPSTCLPPNQGNGLAATAMGMYYVLAAWQENRAFFTLTVPMRSVSATVFWSLGGAWRAAGLWEGAGAAITGLALTLDRRRA